MDQKWLYSGQLIADIATSLKKVAELVEIEVIKLQAGSVGCFSYASGGPHKSKMNNIVLSSPVQFTDRPAREQQCGFEGRRIHRPKPRFACHAQNNFPAVPNVWADPSQCSVHPGGSRKSSNTDWLPLALDYVPGLSEPTATSVGLPATHHLPVVQSSVLQKSRSPPSPGTSQHKMRFHSVCDASGRPAGGRHGWERLLQHPLLSYFISSVQQENVSGGLSPLHEGKIQLCKRIEMSCKLSGRDTECFDNDVPNCTCRHRCVQENCCKFHVQEECCKHLADLNYKKASHSNYLASLHEKLFDPLARIC